LLANANRYQFSSKEKDLNSGLVYYLYRFYDPNLQRWPNRDPIEEKGGINLYGFVKNDPILAVDAFGLMPPGGGYPHRPGPGGEYYCVSVSVSCNGCPGPTLTSCWFSSGGQGVSDAAMSECAAKASQNYCSLASKMSPAGASALAQLFLSVCMTAAHITGR
jgi:RHS repeat-associated protein